MIRLREFEQSDAAVLKQKQMQDADLSEVEEMIRAWQTKTHRGKRFEMLAITEGDAVVGIVSLYERSRSAASVGIEIFFDERGKGYAEEGMRRILERAKVLGYSLILDQVAANNQPSISLHEKLGFETDGYLYKNAKDREVLLYYFSL
jgi:phosphinothricin acetyltransferase